MRWFRKKPTGTPWDEFEVVSGPAWVTPERPAPVLHPISIVTYRVIFTDGTEITAKGTEVYNPHDYDSGETRIIRTSYGWHLSHYNCEYKGSFPTPASHSCFACEWKIQPQDARVVAMFRKDMVKAIIAEGEETVEVEVA